MEKNHEQYIKLIKEHPSKNHLPQNSKVNPLVIFTCKQPLYKPPQIHFITRKPPVSPSGHAGPRVILCDMEWCHPIPECEDFHFRQAEVASRSHASVFVFGLNFLEWVMRGFWQTYFLGDTVWVFFFFVCVRDLEFDVWCGWEMRCLYWSGACFFIVATFACIFLLIKYPVDLC